MPTLPELPAMRWGKTETHEERFPNGGPVRAAWTAAQLADGSYVLHGDETWNYRSGKKQWSAKYDRGRKVGLESYWGEDGKVQWTVDHKADGASVWTQFWPNGQKRTESTWRDLRAIGAATAWDASGKETGRAQF